MKEGVLILGIFLLHCVTSAPSDLSLVISSTEPSEKNVEGNAPSTAPTFPIIYEMDITANISNRFAKALVASKVKNPDRAAKEATFTVVLPEKAFISEFVMEIGGQSYKAYVKEKEEAKKIYNEAVASGQSAAHVAVNARDSNKFTVSVNIEPEAKAVFLLTYEELLERKNDQYELVLNLHPGQLVEKLNVEVHINESRALKFVKTPSLRSGNEISKNDDKLDPSSDIQVFNSTTAVVKFTPDLVKQKQFAKELGTKESEGLSGQFIVQYDVERDSQGGEILLEDGYFVHFFAPKDLEPLPKHAVFVLDTSGSMGGSKIDQLKDAMYSILTDLRKIDIVSIVEFDSNINVWDIKSQNATFVNYENEENYEEPFNKLSEINLPLPTEATSENIEKAKNVIKKFDADGGTHIIGGLETALYLVKRQQDQSEEKSKKFQPLIIFLTDGQANEGVYETENITNIVTRLNLENNKAPIFTLSFGYGADKEFLRKVSLKNLGFSRHIYEAADASLQLQEFYKQISSPLLNNVHFKYNADVQTEVTNAEFPIYFEGSELVVAGKYEGEVPPIIVRCFGPEGPFELTPIIEKPVTSLERLWAYLTVKQTLEQRESVDNKTELTKKALDLALKYSFVTDVSSLVVVKPNETRAVDTEDAATGSQPEFDSSYGSYNLMAKSSLSGAPLMGGGGWSAISVDADMDYDEPEVLEYQTTEKANETEALSSIKQTLENAMPWIGPILNSNGSLCLPLGSYELGSDSLPVSRTECPKTPLNSTEKGTCSLLQDCPEVFSSLTDVQVYQQYFCAINNIYAGVCCPNPTNRTTSR